MTSADLNALIGSRICHDLISPLGAIGNGVELLTMSGVGAVPEMALIEESVENANARIKYYRVAFGASSPSASLGAAEMRSVVNGMYKSARMQVDWRVDSDQTRDQVKLAFLLLQCVEGTMPWGGKVSITHTGEMWTITATADRLKKDDALWDILRSDTQTPGLAAADVHFALAPLAAKSAERKIAVEWQTNRLRVSF